MTTQESMPRPMKPYLINAVLEYCRDTGTTPYVMVAVDHACRVPEEYVRDGRIIFDVTDEAVNRLNISDEELTFQARFGENNEIFDVVVPLNRIIAVTPLECQQFALQFEVTDSPEETSSKISEPTPERGGRRPMRVK